MALALSKQSYLHCKTSKGKNNGKKVFFSDFVYIDIKLIS
jgi:hypothetical protein